MILYVIMNDSGLMVVILTSCGVKGDMSPKIPLPDSYIYNTCALSKHMGNMCMRLRNAGKGEAWPSLFPRFAPNTHIYLYASTVHMYCIYPAILNRK